MNTSAGYYQAPRPPRVPLDEVLIKLHPEGFHQAFEADGLNVGPGGISMRASVLPQVGSMLRCHLDNPPGGEAIQMIGRVVWAHESGEHAGEFGIRFTHLSNEDQVRIEALIQRWGRRTAKAPTVRLQLDGVESPIVAELKSETESALTVEQPLPFLAIGSAMLNQNAGRRGHLEAVELRMDDDTPRLVLSIGYEATDDDPARDTMPDVPPVIRSSRPSGEIKLEDTPRIVRYDQAEEEASREPLARRLRGYAHAATDRLGTAVTSLRTGVTDGLVPRTGAKIRDLSGLTARFIAALRARIDDKPRRKQVPRSEAARAHLKNTRRHRRRYVMLAAMVAGIVAAGWGIYVWAAGSVAAPAEASVSEKSPAQKSLPEANKATRQRTPPDPAPAEQTSAKSAVPEIAVQGAPLPPEPVRGTSFGAKKVPRGEKYVLRMSNPVTEMEGIVEDDGFSVTIPGSLSLSRAGPIASAHPDVEHASILNRGDFSELTVRFVAGRQPPYRVDARGPAIELTIAR